MNTLKNWNFLSLLAAISILLTLLIFQSTSAAPPERETSSENNLMKGVLRPAKNQLFAQQSSETINQSSDSSQFLGGSATNCRYGVAHLYGSTSAPWLDTMAAGWYLNFAPWDSAPSSSGEFVHTIKLTADNVGDPPEYSPPLTSLVSLISNNPGGVWILGSEMESPRDVSGGKTTPELYAEAYHEGYTFIKNIDPTAQIAFGGISSMSPVRMLWMERAWDAYQNIYGVPMPVDVWNTHLYIFPERRWNSTSNAAGRIPAGISGNDRLLAKQEPEDDNSSAVCWDENDSPNDSVYCVADHDNIDIFIDQITNLRQWMADHGEQDKPLIISEWSVLWQDQVDDEFGVDFNPGRVNDYMIETLDWMENTTDANIGYPADGNHLVQQWLWYPDWTEDNTTGDASDLLVDEFEGFPAGDVAALSNLGSTYRAHALAGLTTNLMVGATTASQTGDGTAVLEVSFYNNGTEQITQPFDVTFYADAALTQVIGSSTIQPNIGGCARVTHAASVQWTGLTTGTHDYWVKIDGQNDISETDESNADNVANGSVVIALPAVPHLSIARQADDLDLSWTAAQDATSYNLYRSATPYFVAGAPYQTNIAGLSFLDMTVGGDVNDYYYQVTAVTPSGESAPSNEVGKFVFLIVGGSSDSIDTPQINAQSNGTDVILGWTAVSGATGYNIFRDLDNPYFSPAAAYDTDTAPPYLDAGALLDLNNYYYVVQATGAGSLESGFSNRVGKFVFLIESGE